LKRLETTKRTYLFFSPRTIIIQGCKNKPYAVTIKILFVSRVVQGIAWYVNLWLTFIPVCVQVVTTAQDKGNHQKYLAEPDKTGSGYPVMSKIFVPCVDDFLTHFIIICCAKIRAKG